MTPEIAAICILTADRPALLERALRSYAPLAGARSATCVVLDDSKTASAALAAREATRSAGARFGFEARFAGAAERAAYVERLLGVSSVPRAVLEGALLRSAGHTTGQNRNAQLLDSLGAMAFVADDDTIAEPVRPPGEPAGPLTSCAGEAACDYWFYRGLAETRAGSPSTDVDVLHEHESLLGRRIAELPYPGPPGRVVESLRERLEHPDATVVATFSGLAGDCGWGPPFGLWNAPMGYLGMRGASLQRLAATEAQYREACQSRQVLRVAAAPALSDFGFSMLTFHGVDNRKGLPPNMPLHRGQDLVFGQLLWRCFDPAVAGHVPVALRHEPDPPRRYWPGEMTRGAAGIDVARLLIEALELHESSPEETTPAQRLAALGRHLIALAELPELERAQRLQQRLRLSNQRFAKGLREISEETQPWAPWFAADVDAYTAKLEHAAKREDYWVPLDLWSVDGPVAAAARARKTLADFGALLLWWPEILAAAREVGESGTRLSVAA